MSRGESRSEQLVQNVLARRLGWPVGEICLEESLEALGLDSIDTLVIIFELEEEVDSLSPEDILTEDLVSVGSLVRMVDKMRCAL